MTKKLNLKNLIPATNYAVQVRAVNDVETSEWSRKFTFTTTDDTVAPKVPTGFNFVVGDGNYLATWNEVTLNVDDSNARIIRYGLSLTANSTTKIIQVAPTEDGTVEYSLTKQRAEALFGANVVSVDAKVRAVNIGSIQGAYTATINAVLGGTNVPTGGVVEAIVDGLKISWSPPANMTNVDGYHVYLSTSGAGFTPSGANRVYEGTDTNFTWNTTTYAVHYIKIRSYSRFGRESADLALSGTPLAPYVRDIGPPTTPGGLTVTIDRTGGTARAHATWTFSATGLDDDIQQFIIKWRKVGDTDWFQAVAPKDVRDAWINLPLPYVNYEFQIFAQDYTGNLSSPSSIVTLSAGIPGAPPQVTGLAVVPGFGDLQITWSQSAHDDVTYGGYYEVQVSTNSGFTGSPLTYRTGNLSLAVAGLALSTAYWVRVRAVDADANAGTYSTSWTGSTTGVTPTPLTDGNPPASSPAATAAAGIGAIYVTFPPVANADRLTYEVHVGTVNTFTPSGATKAAEISGTAVTLLLDGAGAPLSYATTYFVKVIAKDPDGAAAAGTVSAGVSPRKAGTGDIVTIIADQIATGSLGAATVTIASDGSIRSTGYVAATSGYMISDTAVDIQTGIINFGTLKAGTITATTVKIGATGNLIVDSTGAIKSNNYSPGSTGWSLSSTGLDLPGLALSAGQISGDTITGRALRVTNYIQSSNYNGSSLGWRLDSTTFTMFAGTITGVSLVQANTLQSNLSATYTASGKKFSISSSYAEVENLYIYGNTTVPGSSSHFIQSNGYSGGAGGGWKIDGSGAATFGSLTAYGTLRSGTSTIYVQVSGNGTGGRGRVEFVESGYTTSYLQSDNGVITMFSGAGLTFNASGGTIRFNNALSGSGGGTLSVSNKLTVAGGSNSPGDAALDVTSFNASGTARFQNPLIANQSIDVYGGIDLFVGSLDMNGNAIGNCATLGGGTNITGSPTWNYGGAAGGTANVNWNAGQLRQISSVEAHKENIVPLTVSKQAVLSIDPYAYHRKETPQDEIEYGVVVDRIADGLYSEELEPVILREKDGSLQNFDYYKFGVLQQIVLRDHEEEIKQLRAELDELKMLVKTLAQKS